MPLKSLFLALALIPCLVGCGSSGAPTPGAPPSFAATLAPAKWQDGDWTFAFLIVTYMQWDDANGAWLARSIKTEAGTLTMNQGGLSGSAVVAEVHDGTVPHTTPGFEMDGVLVGDTLVLTGHVDGTTIGVTATAPSGVQLMTLGAPYDGEVTADASDRWIAGRGSEGVGASSLAGTHAGCASFFEDLLWVAPPSSTPDPMPVSFGDQPSAYMDGTYRGEGGTYGTSYDPILDEYYFNEIDFDFELTLTGNAIVGTATVTYLGDLLDFEGYAENDVIPLKGSVIGTMIFLEADDPTRPDFDWRLVWSLKVLTGHIPQVPGTITEIVNQYGVHTQTATEFGGECFSQLSRQ